MSSEITPDVRPDVKDWTWVLQRRCAECGFDVTALDPALVAGLIRDNGAQWHEILQAPPDDLRRRDRVDRWTTLEYAAHVRDVFRRYGERLVLMLQIDDPLFENWDQDATARDERYNEQDPVAVGRELIEAASRLADGFDRVSGQQWQRTGRRSDGAHFTVETFARYMIHDPVHHIWDVTSSG